MRRALLALLLLLILALPAQAQAPLPGPSASLVVVAQDRAFRPLADAVQLPVSLTVACDAALASHDTTVTYALVRAPAWAELVIKPERDERSAAACVDGELRFEAMLEGRLRADAPAFMPEAVRVEATVDQPLRAPTVAVADAPIVADFAGVVDVSTPTIATAGSDGIARFPLRVTNHGNAPTRIGFEAPAPPGVDVDAPQPVLLASLAGGPGPTRADALLLVRMPADQHAPLPLVLSWRTSYALDAGVRGPGGALNLLVLPPDPAGEERVEPLAEEARPLPAPGALPALALVAMVGRALRKPRA